VLTQDHAVGLRNEIHNSVFPHSILNSIISLAAPPVIMFSKHSTKIPLVRDAHRILWRIASNLPLYAYAVSKIAALYLVSRHPSLSHARHTVPSGRGQYMSPRGRAAVTAGLTGTGIFLGLLVARRYILRALLGYRGWMYEVRAGHALTGQGLANFTPVCITTPCLCPCPGAAAAELEDAWMVRGGASADQYQAAAVFLPALPSAPPRFVPGVGLDWPVDIAHASVGWLLRAMRRHHSCPPNAVPPLQATVDRYLGTIKHILPADEYARHEAVCNPNN
jgi:hypothetical protein